MTKSTETSVALDPQFLKQIQTLAKANPSIQKILLFGSRATFTNRDKSDVDLCVFLTEGSKDSHFKLDLEEDSTIPYFFDVVYWHELSDECFKNEILSTGVCVYGKA